MTLTPLPPSPPSSLSVVFDEYGRPFIILKEQQQKARVKGVEAQKVRNIEFDLEMLLTLPSIHRERTAGVRCVFVFEKCLVLF